MARLIINKKDIMTPRPSCFCCKLPLNINRNYSGNEYIYFDKHLYHKDCFIKLNIIKKKCIYCSNDIDIKENDNNVIYYDKHYFHKECFIEWCHATKKPTPKRMMALDNIDKYIDEANSNISSLFIKKNISKKNIEQYTNDAGQYISDWFDESDLCSFLREEYDIRKLPWVKIKQVIDGQSKKNDIPIPARDLLDMWIRKIDYLRKANQKFISTSDHEISTKNLLLYDLSILVDKYDGYLKWKEKQKILEIENRKKVEESKMPISQGIICEKSNESNFNQKNDDMSNLVDDIFDN